MNHTDAIQLAAAAAVTGAAAATLIGLLWHWASTARADRHRRNHYIPSSTGRWRG